LPEFGNGILMLPELRHARNAFVMCLPPSGLLRAVWIHFGAERTWSYRNENNATTINAIILVISRPCTRISHASRSVIAA
jgi:hypothetical protein